MADFDDISFDSGPAPPPRPSAPPGPPLWPIAVGVGLVLGLAAAWYFGTRDGPAESTPAKARTATQTTADVSRRRAEPGEAIDLPPLDQSDAILRALVNRLSSQPAIAAWLTTDGLIRNLVVVVQNVADGETPAAHLAAVKPKGAFATRTSGGATWIDPASYRRYDAIAEAVEGLDARGVARLYATVKPRIDDAYRELMGADAQFARTLERAIVQILRTPVIDEDVQLHAGSVTYAFANPALEGLSGAQRQLLRMGPRSVRIVKAKVREVAGFLGIDDAALPAPDGR
jgi:hypothetical protein